MYTHLLVMPLKESHISLFLYTAKTYNYTST